MAEYDRTELERLQKEAANRIREMQSYAQQVVTPVDELPPMPSFVRTPYTRSGGGSRNDPPPPRREPEREPQRSEEHKEEKSSPFSLLKMFNFKNMDLDADKALILLMIYLLASDEGDELLLLALLYLLI